MQGHSVHLRQTHRIPSGTCVIRVGLSISVPPAHSICSLFVDGEPFIDAHAFLISRLVDGTAHHPRGQSSGRLHILVSNIEYVQLRKHVHFANAIALADWVEFITEVAERTLMMIPAVNISGSYNFHVKINPTYRINFAQCGIQPHQVDVLKRLISAIFSKNKYDRRSCTSVKRDIVTTTEHPRACKYIVTNTIHISERALDLH